MTPSTAVPPVPRYRTGSALSALRLGASTMAQYPRLASALVVVTLVSGALQGLLVWGLREVLLGFDREANVGTLGLALGAGFILTVWLLRAGSASMGEVLTVRLAQTVEAAWMRRVLEKILALSVRFFDTHAQGDLVLASYHDLKGIRQVTLDVGQILLQLPRLVGLVVVAWIMSPKLTLLGLVVVPLGLLPAYSIGQRITVAARKEREALSSQSDLLLQILAGIRIIKVNRGEKRVLRSTLAAVDERQQVVVRQAKGRSLTRLLFEAAAGLGLALVLSIGGRDVARGTLDWQALLSLLVALVAVYNPLLTLLQVYGDVRTAMPFLDRLDRLFAAPVDVLDSPDARPLRAAPSVIELDRISFRYNDRTVLREVSATFRQGETIGIVGPSGVGKSTLLALLLRLYDPTGGRILFDGTDLRQLRRDDLMRHCAIVLQEPFLFDDTVAENIRMGRPDAGMAEVVAAAKAANIHDEIMRMGRGYDTILGRRADGQGVSVGQKQRICIAAALLKNAPLLFLDEATSSLDSVSERNVQTAIDRLMEGRTTFVVAHRLSTLRSADRIMVLDAGELVGFDTHENLLDSCAVYRQLWHAQAAPDGGDGAAGDGGSGDAGEERGLAPALDGGRTTDVL